MTWKLRQAKLKYSIYFVLLILCSKRLEAQQYELTSFTTHQGLPTDLSKSIIQDKDGFIWIGTDAGLARYDGVNFKIFDSDLGTGYVKAFAKNRDGRLYVIHDKGVHEIISKPDTAFFRRVIEANQVATDSTIVYPKAAFVDSKNRLWVSEIDAVSRLDVKSLKRYRFDTKNLSASYLKSFLMFEDYFSSLFTISHNGYLYYFDEAKDQFSEIELTSSLGEVNYQLALEDGRTWLATSTGVYELRTGQDHKVKSLMRIAARGDIISMIKTSSNEIFMGSLNQGLFRVIEAGTLIFENVEGALQRSINYLFEQNNNLWISSDEGIGLVQHSYFATLKTTDPTKFIHAIGPAGDKIIYFSTGNKIYRAKRIRNGEFELTVIKTVSDGYIAYLAPYADGVCFSDSNSSIYFVDQNGKTIKRIDLVTEASPYYYTIFYLMRDSRLNVWACRDHSIGVTKVTSDFQVMRYGEQQGLMSKVIVAKESKKGTMYFGSQGDSTYLYKYDPVHDRFINLSIPLHLKVTVSVNDIFVDDNEDVWLATDAGLFKYANDTIIKIKLDKKYSEQILKSIYINDKNTIWLGTNTGLVKFRNGDLVSLDEYSGMPSKTINYRCLTGDSQGKLWVGTDNGVAFSQGEDKYFEPTPKPIFVSLKINGTETKFSKAKWYPSNSYLQVNFLSLSFPGNKILYQTRLDENSPWSDPMERSEITIPKLKPGQHVFQVRARRIGGYDWSEIASVQFYIRTPWYFRWWAIGIYLLSGTLLFWIAIEFNSRRLISDKRKLEKIIKEATEEILEKNNIINEQNAQLKNVNLELENKVNSQTKEVRQAYAKLLNAHQELDTFVYKSSHDLRGPIARLLGLCHLALLEVKDKTSIEYLAKLEHTSKEMDVLLNRLMRTQKIKNREIFNEPIEIKKVIEYELEQLLTPDLKNKIQVKVDIPNSLVIHTDAFLIGILFENILRNAVQFINVKKDPSIRINASEHESELIISIADNGLGILPEAKKNLFEMFFRATSDISGTGLGLYEAKIICEKLKGSICLNEENSEETEFIINLPLKIEKQLEIV